MPRDDKSKRSSDPQTDELTAIDPFEHKKTDPSRSAIAPAESDFDQLTTQRGGATQDSWDTVLQSTDPLELLASDLGLSDSDAQVRHSSGDFTGDAQALLDAVVAKLDKLRAGRHRP